MLPLPNLDDRMFEDMIQEARKSIPKLFPEWTDENAHDPGITLLELMSWMTEMQQYYLNRVTERNERKFLKLLGVQPHEAVSAKCDVTFTGMDEQIVLPQGTPLQAQDQRFETAGTLRLIPAKLEKVIVRTESVFGDVTSNNHAGVPYYAFGPDALKGARLYLGFDLALPQQTEVALSIKLFEDYPVSVGSGSHDPLFHFSAARVSWTYASGGQREEWQPIELLRDTTKHFSQSGELVFKLPVEMADTSFFPADDKKRFWLCCTLEEDGYELAPKIVKICLNSVQAFEQETLIQSIAFDSSGEPHQVLETTSFLALTGKHAVQVKNEAGEWEDWHIVPKFDGLSSSAQCCRVSHDAQLRTTRIRFGDNVHGKQPPKGEHVVRLIAYAADFELKRMLGASSGLPGQSFEVPDRSVYKKSTMLLQVGYPHPETKKMMWRDWYAVPDFEHSRSTDLHYVYDAEEGVIRFGNNEEGWIPPKSKLPNLRFISLQAGGGVRGNVKEGAVSSFAAEVPVDREIVTVTNPFSAKGGVDQESLNDAKLRVQMELNAPSRAVTAEDYEALACATPGLRVARVKAIPLYKPGMRDYPRVKAPAQMTVAVVPYSERDKPIASKSFLETVRRHLDLHRLLTTELHVIPAEYIKITVRSVVVVEPSHKGEAGRILTQLKRLLQPMDRGEGTEGWKFGRTVYKGDIYGVISRIKGVVYVQDLWLDAEGRGFQKDAGGDIRIPPYALVYSGEHEVELISQTDL